MAKSLQFPEQTTVWAKHQPPYRPLPAYTDETETITLWSLTWRERLSVLLRGRIWLRQANYGQPLQPQALQVACPFAPTMGGGISP
jgi:hypothetical protein